MKRRGERSRAHRKREGAAALEFALVLPLLVILLFGIIDFGYLMFVVSSMNNAAREGARRGAVDGGTTDADVSNHAREAAETYLFAAGLGSNCRINCPTVAQPVFVRGTNTTPGSVTVTVTLPQPRGISGFTYAVLPGATNPFANMGAIRAVSRMRWELTP